MTPNATAKAPNHHTGNHPHDAQHPGGVRHGNVYSAQCPCRPLLDAVASKWSAMVIETLSDGPQRFGALLKQLEGISPKVLTATLRRLEDAGLLTRTVYAQVPVRVDYELTAAGRSAVVPMLGVRSWVESHYDLALAYERRRAAQSESRS